MATATPLRRRAPALRLFAFDRRLGERLVAGADEAGRGCLAGPLVAAAVVLDLDRIRGRARRELGRLNDSKLVPADVRDELADAILRYAEQVTVVSASCRTIDRDGLHVTNLRLLARALASLEPAPPACLVDGFHLGAGAPPHRRVVGGDRRSAAIAAASVVAKVTRDRLMSGPAAERHPGFGFESHVGYSTPGHRHAVRRLGPSRLHRMSFRSAAYEETEAPIPAVAGRA